MQMEPTSFYIYMLLQDPYFFYARLCPLHHHQNPTTTTLTFVNVHGIMNIGLDYNSAKVGRVLLLLKLLYDTPFHSQHLSKMGPIA